MLTAATVRTAAAIRIGGEAPGPVRAGQLGVRVGVLQCLGDPAGGGDVVAASDVAQRAIEGKAGLVVEIDRGQPLGQGEPVGSSGLDCRLAGTTRRSSPGAAAVTSARGTKVKPCRDRIGCPSAVTAIVRAR
jgi:hypothetical protein